MQVQAIERDTQIVDAEFIVVHSLRGVIKPGTEITVEWRDPEPGEIGWGLLLPESNEPMTLIYRCQGNEGEDFPLRGTVVGYRS
ncbi:hypothetical protein [Calidithermus timidus]|jgi:hypothetical protein|uniref:hypothetical protein n=1 Tax=Calidithermus timidus TaxID=307124 RepID=UPI0003711555|nr:hypothetical protein [Calidithermus timidus]